MRHGRGWKRHERRHRKRHRQPYKKGRNYHHLKAIALGGGNELWNLCLTKLERHDYWHRVFGLLDLDQAIELLIRYRRFKEYQKEKVA